MKLSTKSVLFGLVALLLAACGGRQSQQENSGDFNLMLEPMSTAVGETMLMVTLTDAEGNPINDAEVSVKGDMSHAGMTPVLAESSSANDGTYQIPFEWTMSGDWIVTIDAMLPDGTTFSQTFDSIEISGEMTEMEMEEMEHEGEDMEMEESGG